MMPVREWMRDKRVAAVLAVAAIAFVGYRWIGSGKGSAPAVPATAVEPVPAVAVREPAPRPSVPTQPPGSDPSPFPAGWTGPTWAWNRNPFLPPAAERTPAGGAARSGGDEAALAAAAEGAAPELRGTVVSGATAMAIFGSRLVPVGGTVGEWTLYRVEPYRVSLRRGKETRVLELYRQ